MEGFSKIAAPMNNYYGRIRSRNGKERAAEGI